MSAGENGLTHLEAALWYVRLGCAVFPVAPGTKVPLSGSHGVHDATTEEAQLRAWWTANPDAGIGIATGAASGFDVLDVDAGKGGVETLAGLERTHGSLPATVEQLTPHGGRHLLFKHVAGLKNRANLPGAPGLDVRTTGGYIVAWPSRLTGEARGYEWEAAHHPDETKVATWPESLLGLVPKRETGPSSTPRVAANDDARTVARARAYLSVIPGAVAGERGHDRTYYAACKLVLGFNLSPGTALRLLREDFNPRCQPPWTEKELLHKVTDADKEDGERGFLLGTSQPDDGSDADARERPDELCTDLGNARRLVRLHGADLRFTGAHGWVVWDGRRWAPNDLGRVEQLAKDAVKSIWSERHLAQASGNAEQTKALTAWALKSESAPRIDALLTLARTEPEIAVRAADFDGDPWLFNAANGTIDLRTGVLRPHRREDLLTRLSKVDYIPDAKAPKWQAFLGKVQEDAEVRAYLQRRAGYCLTGDTSEQDFEVHHGGGANGKTVYVESLRHAFGDYAVSTPFDTFLVRKNPGPRNDLAALAGARFVPASEPSQGARLDEAVIKQVTGGDEVSARFLFKEFFGFLPQFKVALVANHRPRIRGTDLGIWRRVRLVPWAVTIPAAERDKRLLAKLKEEAPGILRWAVDGCLAWQRQGLNPPPAVLAATEDYRESEDSIRRFVADRCLVAPGAWVTAKALKAAYREWCEVEEEEPVSAKTFASCLEDHGMKRARTGSRGTTARVWTGLQLRGDTGDVSPQEVPSHARTWRTSQGDTSPTSPVAREPGEEG